MQQGEGKGQLKKQMLSYNERDRVFRDAQEFSETLTLTNLNIFKKREEFVSFSKQHTKDRIINFVIGFCL